MLLIIFYFVLIAFVAAFVLFGFISQIYYFKLDGQKQNPFYNPRNPAMKSFHIIPWIKYLKTSPKDNYKSTILFFFYSSIAMGIIFLFLLLNFQAVFYP
jgi:hypothetical protein